MGEENEQGQEAGVCGGGPSGGVGCGDQHPATPDGTRRREGGEDLSGTRGGRSSGGSEPGRGPGGRSGRGREGRGVWVLGGSQEGEGETSTATARSGGWRPDSGGAEQAPETQG